MMCRKEHKMDYLNYHTPFMKLRNIVEKYWRERFGGKDIDEENKASEIIRKTD